MSYAKELEQYAVEYASRTTDSHIKGVQICSFIDGAIWLLDRANEEAGNDEQGNLVTDFEYLRSLCLSKDTPK